MFRKTTLDLNGATVLLTGAGSGIGAAAALALHKRGANVALVDVSAEPVQSLATELKERAIAVPASVTNREAMAAAVTSTIDRFGRLDVVFANAGIAYHQPATIRTMDEATFERIVEVDLLGVYRTVRAALPHVVDNQGHVLITASTSAFFNGVANAPYATAKAGAEMFGRSLRAELAPTRATAGVLYPGWVETPMAASVLHTHPIASQMIKLGYPGPFRRPITSARIAEVIADGIANRRARIVCPRHWIPISVARGFVNPIIDWTLDRHPRMHELLLLLEAEEPRL